MKIEGSPDWIGKYAKSRQLECALADDLKLLHQEYTQLTQQLQRIESEEEMDLMALRKEKIQLDEMRNELSSLQEHKTQLNDNLHATSLMVHSLSKENASLNVVHSDRKHVCDKYILMCEELLQSRDHLKNSITNLKSSESELTEDVHSIFSELSKKSNLLISIAEDVERLAHSMRADAHK